MKQAVCVLIRDKNLILGVARRDNHFDFGLPGGKVEPGESRLTAACRELKEETGIIISENDLDPLFEFVCSGKDDGIDYECLTFLAKDWGGIPKQGDAGPVKWVNEEELIKGSFGSYNEKLFKEEKRIRSLKENIKSVYGKEIKE